MLVGPAVSGPALLLGIADYVIMTAGRVRLRERARRGRRVHRASPIERDRLGRRGRSTSARAASPRSSSTTRTKRWRPPSALLSYLPSNHLEDPPRELTDDPVDRDCARRGVGRAGAAHRVVRRAHRDRRRARRALVLRDPAPLRAEHGHRARTARRPRRRHRGQPTHAAGGQSRHRRGAEGRALRAVVRLVQPAGAHVRRHAAATSPARTSNGAASSVTARSCCTPTRPRRCPASASCCARRTAARTS